MMQGAFELLGDGLAPLFFASLLSQSLAKYSIEVPCHPLS